MEHKITTLDVDDVAEILQCSLPIARDFMNREDFPLLKIGKKLLVEQDALHNYLQQRRVN